MLRACYLTRSDRSQTALAERLGLSAENPAWREGH
jgi:hypothetical protein